jgi:hypothetical protein
VILLIAHLVFGLSSGHYNVYADSVYTASVWVDTTRAVLVMELDGHQFDIRPADVSSSVQMPGPKPVVVKPVKVAWWRKVLDFFRSIF